MQSAARFNFPNALKITKPSSHIKLIRISSLVVSVSDTLRDERSAGMARVRSISTIVIVCGIGIAGVALGWSMAVERRAREAQASQIYDFGRDRAGSILRHAFVINNPTAQVLRIEKVETSCGCTVVQRAPASLAARESFSLPVEIHLPLHGGPFESSVTVFCSDRVPMRLTIRGEAVELVPEAIVFKEVKRGSGAETHITIHSISGRIPKVRQLLFDKKYLNCQIAAPSDSGESRVLVQCQPEAPYGGFVTPLQIQTDDPDNATLRVDVKAHVLRPVEPQSDMISFGSLSALESKTAEVRLVSPYGRPIRIDEVRLVPGDFATADLSAVQMDRAEITIPIRMRGGFKASVYSARLEIKLHAPEEVLTTLDLYARRAEGQP